MEVYSLSDGSWRNLDVNAEVPHFQGYDSAYMKFVSNWMGPCYDEDKKVEAFYVCNEVFQITTLPDDSLIGTNYQNWRTLKLLKESVALIIFPKKDNGKKNKRFLDI